MLTDVIILSSNSLLEFWKHHRLKITSHHSSQPEPAQDDCMAIAAQNIEVSVHSRAGRFQILKEINLAIPKAELHFLMGPSGSGKTTLLQVLAGLLKPTTGNVMVLGQNITHLSQAQLTQFRRKTIGFVFQSFNLFPALTVEENVRLALNVQGVHGRLARQQTQNLLEQVGLKDRALYLPQDLSGGQKQRVAIARALAGNPPIIMADEPTASLDAQNGQSIMELLRRLAHESGSTVLVVTHDHRIVYPGDRVLFIDDGKISNTANPYAAG